MFTRLRGTAILLTCAPWLPLMFWTLGGRWYFSRGLPAYSDLISTNIFHRSLFVVKSEYKPNNVIR